MVDKAVSIISAITPVINMVTSALVVIALAAMSYIVGQMGELRDEIKSVNGDVVRNSKSLIAIDANRFTSNDAVNFMSSISERMATTDRETSARLTSIQTSIAKLPTEVPPRWFVEKVDANSAAIRKLEEAAK